MKNQLLKRMFSATMIFTLMTVSYLQTTCYANGVDKSTTIVESNDANSELTENNTGNNDQYIVVTKSQTACNNIKHQYDEYVDENDSSEALQDENILVTQMTKEEARALENNSNVLSVEKDVVVTANAKKYSKKVNKKTYTKLTEGSENKTKSETEWNIKQIQADDLNTSNQKTGKVKVAILDSGVDVGGDIDVTGYVNLIPGEKEVTPLFQDTTGHGTSIAGIIAANNNEIGITGINPDAEIYSIKVLDENNVAPISRIVEGIYWAIDHDINIINMSFGTSTPSEALKSAIKDAYNHGILLVAAAGNNGEGKTSTIEYPAAYDEVIAVGSVDSMGNRADDSAVGADLELVAPGELIKSTGAFNGEIVTSGTSMAAPHVTGVASLLWQKDLSCSNNFIRELLDASANKLGEEKYYGNGLLDAEYATSIYDKFKKNYKEESTLEKNESIISENLSPITTFNNVDYVEGRWHLSLSGSNNDHGDLVTYGANQNGLTDATILKYIKLGAQYPDKEVSNISGMKENPQFHGFFRDKYSPTQKRNVNYIACYIYLGKVALKSGDASSVSKPAALDSTDYSSLKSGISTSSFKGRAWSDILGTNNATNRKWFLWGVAMHTATDVFSHSSYTPGGVYIDHKTSDSDPEDADQVSYINSRYKAAKMTADIIVSVCINNQTPNEYEFQYASDYYNGSFKLANLYNYALQVNPSLYSYYDAETIQLMKNITVEKNESN